MASSGGFDQSGFSPSREDANDVHLENAQLAPPHLRWRRDALQPPEIQQVRLDRNTCVDIPVGGLRCVTWNTRGLIGPPARKRSTSLLHEFLQAIQVLVPQFRLYGTFFFSNNLNAGGSAVCIYKGLLPDGAMVTHVIACQGRNHAVNIQSGDRNLVVINVHFEPDLTPRNHLERLRPITPHWRLYPEALGVITVDFFICESEEGRFNVWNQTYTDGDTGKASYFFMSSKSLSLTYKERLYSRQNYTHVVQH